MAKTKTQFFCQNCGQSSPKWVGKCGSCNEWNTYVEEIVKKNDDPRSSPFSVRANGRAVKPLKLDEISAGDEKRTPLYDKELSRVLGGGLVPGSLILFGGEPGI